MYQSQRCVTHFPGDAITNILPVLIASVYRESLTVGVRKTLLFQCGQAVLDSELDQTGDIFYAQFIH